MPSLSLSDDASQRILLLLRLSSFPKTSQLAWLIALVSGTNSGRALEGAVGDSGTDKLDYYFILFLNFVAIRSPLGVRAFTVGPWEVADSLVADVVPP